METRTEERDRSFLQREFPSDETRRKNEEIEQLEEEQRTRFLPRRLLLRLNYLAG
ncbi:hypothetical protein K0M31_016961, partial [Melipona bicolor]